ncbi:flagellar basal body-associated FliL family protein [Enterobacteriaceae bacterium LUAb1]
MSIKTFFLSLVLVVMAAILTAALVIFGNAWLQDNQTGEENAGFSFFSEKESENEVAYVEIKNVVITLRSDGGKERYLLLDLAAVTNGNEDFDLLEKVTPELKSSAVSMFAGLNYSQVRNLSIAQLRGNLLNSFNESLKKQSDKKLVSDVLISKMIFQ